MLLLLCRKLMGIYRHVIPGKTRQVLEDVKLKIEKVENFS